MTDLKERIARQMTAALEDFRVSKSPFAEGKIIGLETALVIVGEELARVEESLSLLHGLQEGDVLIVNGARWKVSECGNFYADGLEGDEGGYEHSVRGCFLWQDIAEFVFKAAAYSPGFKIVKAERG